MTHLTSRKTTALARIAALSLWLFASIAALAQDANEREALRLRALMFPSTMNPDDQARTRAQLMSYWMLPLKERKQLYDQAMRGERRSSANLAQAAGLTAGLSAGNPLSASGLSRGGTTLAVVSAVSLLMPRGNDAAAVFSRVYVPAVAKGGSELVKPKDGTEEAIRLTIDSIREAAASIDRRALCVDGCDTDIQVWHLEGTLSGVIKPLTLVWRRGELVYAIPDHARNAAMSFYPRFESRGLNGWVIELADVVRDAHDKPIRVERDGAQLPQLSETWSRTGDGVRFLQQLTSSGHIVQGRVADQYVAALGRVYDIGELTASGYLSRELLP